MLIQEQGINTAAALELFREVMPRAERSAHALNKAAYGADEIADQLELILKPILMKMNLLEEAEYTRIYTVVFEWYPKELDPEDLQHCGLIQQIMLSLLPVLKNEKEREKEIENKIKETISAYHLFLQAKMDALDNDDSNKSTAYYMKLQTRLAAIKELNTRIENKESLEEADIKQVKSTLQTCLSNKPDWSERPFLQILTDILSFGFKPLYRFFNSREKDFESELSQSVKKSKL
jgi:hypothetical protein